MAQTHASNPTYRLVIGALLALLLLGTAGLVFFFARLYQNDMRALEDFVASYTAYDQAIANLKAAASSEAAQTASQALADLKTRAAFRISSVIKNEKKVMSAAQQIADLSGKELEALAAYPKAAGSNAAEVEALTRQRQAAYAGFLELGK